MWFGDALGGPFWVASSIAMCLWTLWFGLGLARAEFRIRAVHRAHSRG
jgi:hypothetical protein